MVTTCINTLKKKYIRVSINRISKRIKMESTYVFFELFTSNTN